ncbi:MAG: hypothetical protein HOC71_16385 [Candidatus Latescibacteria bacterium]|jgi:zinc D-Ala-D-Ala dipeptidase|nr:hypothetical protein [Candidatus Latescibacterota bacterium]
MPAQRDNEKARRDYWTKQMESAYGFMDKILEYPVEECGESLVSLPQSVREEGVAVQFSQTRLAENHERLFCLRRGLVEDFITASREMNDRGWTLRVEDGFRSRVMQKDVALHESVFDNTLKRVIWETNGKMPEPKLMLRRLTALCATRPKIGTHMSGSAIDISVLRTDDLSEIERSGSYLELSELTPMASPFASAHAILNRTEISEIMQRHGFIAYPYEFWHYSKGDAYAEHITDSGKPARYGPVDFDIANGNITPISNPKAPLHSLEDIEKHIELSLNRLNANRQED